MATEIAKAYVQIIPSAEGISGKIKEALSGESKSAGEAAGQEIANALGGKLKKALAALGIGKVIKDAISSGSDYQTSLSKLGTIADSSAMSLDDMSSRIADMSSQLGISQSALAEAAYSTISATGDTANSLNLVEQASKLATAGFTDTDSAISVLTTSINAYGLSADQAAHISDSLITTQNLGVTTVADLAANMGRAIATASGYGVSLENLEAAYIGTTKSGISTAESTTYISGMLAELGKESSGVSKILKDKTGKSFGQLMASGSSLSDVLKVLYDSTNNDSEAFMNLWSSQEAGKAANALVNQGLDTFNDNLKTLEEQSGITESAYGQMTDTFAWKMQDIKTKAQNLGIKLFQSLYPVLDQLIAKASELIDNIDTDQLSADISTAAQAAADALSKIDLAQAVNDISAFISIIIQQAPQVISFFSQLAPVISQAAGFIGKLISNANLIIPLVSGIAGLMIGSKIAGVVTGIMNLVSGVGLLQGVISALGGPVTIVITLITGVISALVALYNNNETFRNAVDTAWQAIQTVVTTVVTAIQTVWTTVLQPVFQAIADFVQNVLWPVIQVVFMAIGEIVQTVFELIQGIWENILKPVFTAIGSFLSETLGPVFETVFGAIQTVVEGVFSAIKGFWDSTLKPVFDSIGEAVNWLYDHFFEPVFDDIREKVEDVFGGIKSFISPIVDWLKGIFDFHWSLPSIKLPHFSIEGEFSLTPPSVPHFSIDWYAKAMDQPYVFTTPTIFGAGEAGDEMIYGHDSLMEDIRNATAGGTAASEIGRLRSETEAMLALMRQYMPGIANQRVVLDTGTLVGATAPAMDEEIARISGRRRAF